MSQTTQWENKNIPGETHTNFRVRKITFFYLRAKIDLPWINILEFALTQKNIDPGQINFRSDMEKWYFSDSQKRFMFLPEYFYFLRACNRI